MISTNDNSLNTAKGRDFQQKVAQALKIYFGVLFDQEVPLEIGVPPKPHKFDLVSADKTIVVECKNYSWTSTGNIPIAKLTTLDQAVFYFSFLHNRKCVLILRKDVHPKRRETLAQYYCRIKGHLLQNVTVLELDVDSEKVTAIHGS